MGGVDLNCEQVQSPRFPLGGGYVYRQDDVRTAHGFSALGDGYSDYGAVRRSTLADALASRFMTRLQDWADGETSELTIFDREPF